MSRVAVATINTNALKHNLSVVKTVLEKSASQSKILAVIKANAYGHGLLPVAKSLESADAFAVAHYEEAVALRNEFPEKTIVLLQGYADEVEMTFLLSQSIQPVIHTVMQIELLESFAEKNPAEEIHVWLKIDTGMHRLGIPVADFDMCWARLNQIENLVGNIKILSHFANADVPAHQSNEAQSQLFKKLSVSKQCEKSLSNSAGLLSRLNDHYDWVRPGIMLYGVSPFQGGRGIENNLKAVMSLTSRIIAITKVKKDHAIGYGSSWVASVDTTIAVVGIGYGDGYPRHIAENTPVLIKGKRYPIVGRVSMDMICVNLGNELSHQIGDDVLLWGDGLPVEEIAEKASTIAYELLCQVTARVRFDYCESENAGDKRMSELHE